MNMVKQNHPSSSLMSKVLQDLTDGCDSQVQPPGTKATKSTNHFPEPEVDIPRIADAIASELKSGHMAGPFSPGIIPEAKINGLISIKKPNGSRRQVGNLSDPPGFSFNDNINPAVLHEWKVNATTTKQFADKIIRAGRNSVMSCSDMTNAYKNLPVKLSQRRLQVFQFCGKQFVDLRLIFGDKCACMFFDRFHHCIIWNFVWPLVNIPVSWVGRTIDDVTTVSPEGSEENTLTFVKQYREILTDLNIGAAPEDPLRRKAFDCAQEGEVLGTIFNTQNMTWKMPEEKLSIFISLLNTAIQDGETLTLHNVEVIHGKLNNLIQLSPPLNFLVTEVLIFLKELLTRFYEDGLNDRHTAQYSVSADMRFDLRSLKAILK